MSTAQERATWRDLATRPGAISNPWGTTVVLDLLDDIADRDKRLAAIRDRVETPMEDTYMSADISRILDGPTPPEARQ